MTEHALSLKQPWATLLVHGLKSIEVRRWATHRRGPVLIHAARVPDERPEAWAHVPPHLKDAAALRGGIIGSAQLLSCEAYRSAETFVRDCALHLNEPDWFTGTVLYGFKFDEPQVLPFRACPGWFRFFPVKAPAHISPP